MSDPILNLNDQNTLNEFVGGFRRDHPGLDWIKKKATQLLGKYDAGIGILVNGIFERLKKGEIPDQEALDKEISAAVSARRAREPDQQGGSDDAAVAAPDLSRVQPGISMPVAGYSGSDKSSPFDEAFSEETASRTLDIQKLTLDQPLEWSLARDKLTPRMHGPEVEQVQNGLLALGYDVGKKGADSHYGPDTAAAVEKYQLKNGLEVDGIFGKSELSLMKMLLED